MAAAVSPTKQGVLGITLTTLACEGCGEVWIHQWSLGRQGPGLTPTIRVCISQNGVWEGVSILAASPTRQGVLGITLTTLACEGCGEVWIHQWSLSRQGVFGITPTIRVCISQNGVWEGVSILAASPTRQGVLGITLTTLACESQNGVWESVSMCTGL